MPTTRHSAFAAILILAGSPAIAQPNPVTPTTTVSPTTSNPNLAVATVKLESGTRVSKIIGATVYIDANEKVGTIDDVILTDGDKATVAIVSVGGFLGLGSKLVALPYRQIKQESDKVVLTGVTKDSLGSMPGFIY